MLALAVYYVATFIQKAKACRAILDFINKPAYLTTKCCYSCSSKKQ